MSYLVFRTKGLIDLTAFTTFGVNSKPNSENPIGFFGTGLKYATSVLARQGGEFRVFIDGVEHEFYTSKKKFRDKQFDVVCMRKRKNLFATWRYEKLPFTTELGKTWEMWQVYRELESNTRDENGCTFDQTDKEFKVNILEQIEEVGKGHTIIVSNNPELLKVYRDEFREDIDPVFLRQSEKLDVSTGNIEVYDRPSEHLYYRGVRVYKNSKKSVFTYNMLSSVDLTEDRTLKYPSFIRSSITFHLMACDNKEFIKKCLATKDTFESNLDYEYMPVYENFIEALQDLEANRVNLSPRIEGYLSSYRESLSSDSDNVCATFYRKDWCNLRKIIQKAKSIEHVGDDKYDNMIDAVIGSDHDLKESFDKFTEFLEGVQSTSADGDSSPL